MFRSLTLGERWAVRVAVLVRISIRTGRGSRRSGAASLCRGAIPGPVRAVSRPALRLHPNQLAAADAGTGVAVVLPSSVDHEIAVAGAVFVRADRCRLVSVLQDVERLESGKGFIRTKTPEQPAASGRLRRAAVAALRSGGAARCAPALRCQTRPARVRPAGEGQLVGAGRGSTRRRLLPADARSSTPSPTGRTEARRWRSIWTRVGRSSSRAIRGMIGRVDLCRTCCRRSRNTFRATRGRHGRP